MWSRIGMGLGLVLCASCGSDVTGPHQPRGDYYLLRVDGHPLPAVTYDSTRDPVNRSIAGIGRAWMAVAASSWNGGLWVWGISCGGSCYPPPDDSTWSYYPMVGTLAWSGDRLTLTGTQWDSAIVGIGSVRGDTLTISWDGDGWPASWGSSWTLLPRPSD